MSKILNIIEVSFIPWNNTNRFSFANSLYIYFDSNTQILLVNS